MLDIHVRDVMRVVNHDKSSLIQEMYWRQNCVRSGQVLSTLK